MFVGDAFCFVTGGGEGEGGSVGSGGGGSGEGGGGDIVTRGERLRCEESFIRSYLISFLQSIFLP